MSDTLQRIKDAIEDLKEKERLGGGVLEGISFPVSEPFYHHTVLQSLLEVNVAGKSAVDQLAVHYFRSVSDSFICEVSRGKGRYGDGDHVTAETVLNLFHRSVSWATLFQKIALMCKFSNLASNPSTYLQPCPGADTLPLNPGGVRCTDPHSSFAAIVANQRGVCVLHWFARAGLPLWLLLVICGTKTACEQTGSCAGGCKLSCKRFRCYQLAANVGHLKGARTVLPTCVYQLISGMFGPQEVGFDVGEMVKCAVPDNLVHKADLSSPVKVAHVPLQKGKSNNYLIITAL